MDMLHICVDAFHTTCDLHMAFKTQFLQDFVTKLCRWQATVMLDHENVNIRNWPRQGSTQKVQKARAWWWSGI